jgi:hypothetical protein
MCGRLTALLTRRVRSPSCERNNNRGLRYDRHPRSRADLPNDGLSVPTDVALQQGLRRSDQAVLFRDLRTGHMRKKANHL